MLERGNTRAVSIIFVFLSWKILLNLYDVSWTCIWNCVWMLALKSHTYKNQACPQTFKCSLSFHRPHKFLSIGEVTYSKSTGSCHHVLIGSQPCVESLKYFWESLRNVSHVLTEKQSDPTGLTSSKVSSSFTVTHEAKYSC